jgi:hypothetical protein
MINQHRILTALCGFLLSFASVSAIAHGTARTGQPSEAGREIVFPDTADRLTLVVDLHTHSVFSDGHVWPSIRVEEAIRDGLDALAITEHLEWQPHLEDIPHPDRNRAYEQAVASLPAGDDLILIAGSEITRGDPQGHMNAVFISDANALIRNPPTVPEPYDARAYARAAWEWPATETLAEAERQGAFVFWNHSWSNFPNRMTEITDFHRQATADGQLHGIEIANGDTYSPESFQIALDLGLTPVGVSDVHNLIEWDYLPHTGGHRPVNLVFATERTPEAIREALFEGHTVVWFKNLLLGKEEHLKPLIDASLVLEAPEWRDGASVLEFSLRNTSDASFELENLSEHTLVTTHDTLVAAPHATTTVEVRVRERSPAVDLRFRVRNALSAPREHPEIGFRIEIAE